MIKCGLALRGWPPTRWTGNIMSKQNTKVIAIPEAKPREGKTRLTSGKEMTDAELGEAILSLPEPQRAKVREVLDKARDRPCAPPMKLVMEDGNLSVTYPGEHEAGTGLLLMAEIGTCDPSFHAGIMRQVATLGAHGAKLDETNSNFVVSVVRAVQPRDELESMLAVQMGAVHAATMMMARRLNQTVNIPQQDSAERALNKLARTFAAQMETLKRYRTGGQQKVTVEHVTVNEGGQAIVGSVLSHGRVKE